MKSKNLLTRVLELNIDSISIQAMWVLQRPLKTMAMDFWPRAMAGATPEASEEAHAALGQHDIVSREEKGPSIPANIFVVFLSSIAWYSRCW